MTYKGQNEEEETARRGGGAGGGRWGEEAIAAYHLWTGMWRKIR